MGKVMGLYIRNSCKDVDTVQKFINAVEKYYKCNINEINFIKIHLEHFFKYEPADSIFVYYLNRYHQYDVYDVSDLDADIIITHPDFKNVNDIGKEFKTCKNNQHVRSL